jgi:CheY-like chemotaxis protein/predicted transcriptional regulator
MAPNARSFSIEVMSRILSALAENEQLKRTNLAGKTSLNYIVCMKYVKLMKALSLVDYASEDSNEIHITEIGKRFNDSLSIYLKDRSDPDAGGLSLDLKQLEQVSSRNSSLTPEMKEPARNAGDSGKGSNEGSARVMLIDDEPDALLTYKLFLTDAGYVVDTYANASDALHRLASAEASSYKLVISDIRMPGINGLKLYQKVREMDKNFKFIFITALDAVDELVSIMPDVEPEQIVRKPVDKKRFMQIVSKAVEDRPQIVQRRRLSN